MDEEKTVDYRAHDGKMYRCPFHPGVLCSEWLNDEYRKYDCPYCGWHPQEEKRRKERLKELVASGEWFPHLYSLKHHG